MKTIKVRDIITEEQLQQVLECKSHAEIRDRVIVPNLAEINRRLGQENDADYLAYAIEHAIHVAGLARIFGDNPGE